MPKTHAKQREETTTVSVILEDRQIKMIRAIQTERSTPYARASFASVTREVIDLGLERLSCVSDMIYDTSTDEREKVA